jgi:hypothetical protein
LRALDERKNERQAICRQDFCLRALSFCRRLKRLARKFSSLFWGQLSKPLFPASSPHRGIRERRHWDSFLPLIVPVLFRRSLTETGKDYLEILSEDAIGYDSKRRNLYNARHN